MDSTELKPYYRQFWKTAWPSVAEQVLVSLMTAVDTMMVGQLGKEAVAATGLTNQPRLLLLLPAQALNIGVMTVIGMRKGAGQREKANQCMNTSILICLAISLFVTLVSLVFAEPILKALGANADTLAPAVDYFRIIAVGCVFQSVCLTVTAAQRGIGKTKISMTTNLIANGVNVVLNYILINGKLGFPAMGVHGAAIATMIGNVCAMLLSFCYVLDKKGYLCIRGKYGFEKLRDMRFMAGVSVGGLGERAAIRVGNILYSTIAAHLGTAEFASFTICNRFTGLSWSFGDGLGIAASALVAQSLGAREPEKAKRYGTAGIRTSLAVAVSYSLLLLIGRRFWCGLFTADEEVLALCLTSVYVIVANAICHIPQFLLVGLLRGAGDTNYLANVSLAAAAVIKPLVAYVLAFVCGFGLVGVYAGLMVDVIVRFAFSVHRFRSADWIEKSAAV